jgi:hypothetical protein
MLVAICPDNEADSVRSASGRWTSYLEAAGCTVKMVDVRAPDILAQLEGCDGFMWRWAHFGGMGRIARRLLPVVEGELGIATYPDLATCWHYDDKIAQSWLFEAHGIPTPNTRVFFDRSQCLEWLKTQSFPLVIKLATGAGSNNVMLVHGFEDARAYMDRVFSYQVNGLSDGFGNSWRRRVAIMWQNVVKGEPVTPRDNGYERQAGYALFQEFLPNNAYDTRVTVIGNRAFGFRRWNREGDFRASGSGRVDYDMNGIDLRFVRLAFATTQRLGMQSCAIDGMWRGDEPVTGEVSYTYVSRNVQDCPGHWELDGDPETGTLHWVEGQMWPEQAQVEDFLGRLAKRTS